MPTTKVDAAATETATEPSTPQIRARRLELDYDTGRVVFRATNVFCGTSSAPPIVAGLVHTAVAEVDRLTPLLTLLLRMTPEELGRLNLRLFLQREDLLPPVDPGPDGG